MNSQIQVSSIEKEGILKASKYLRLQMLLEKEELKALFAEFSDFYLVYHSKISEKNTSKVDKDVYLALYGNYIDKLKKDPSLLTRNELMDLSLCFSKTLDAFFSIPIDGNKELIKLRSPAILVQPFSFFYEKGQGSIFTTVHSQNRVLWGIECSFPQFYQDPKTLDTIEILKDKTDPNTQMFKSLQRWVRRNTEPVCLLINGQEQIHPFRLGSSCFSWINEYPLLATYDLKVKRKEDGN